MAGFLGMTDQQFVDTHCRPRNEDSVPGWEQLQSIVAPDGLVRVAESSEPREDCQDCGVIMPLALYEVLWQGNSLGKGQRHAALVRVDGGNHVPWKGWGKAMGERVAPCT